MRDEQSGDTIVIATQTRNCMHATLPLPPSQRAAVTLKINVCVIRSPHARALAQAHKKARTHARHRRTIQGRTQVLALHVEGEGLLSGRGTRRVTLIALIGNLHLACALMNGRWKVSQLSPCKTCRQAWDMAEQRVRRCIFFGELSGRWRRQPNLHMCGVDTRVQSDGVGWSGVGRGGWVGAVGTPHGMKINRGEAAFRASSWCV
jgi:hypothetical protein